MSLMTYFLFYLPPKHAERFSYIFVDWLWLYLDPAGVFQPKGCILAQSRANNPTHRVPGAVLKTFFSFKCGKNVKTCI